MHLCRAGSCSAKGPWQPIADEVEQLGCRRAFVLSDAHHAENAAAKISRCWATERSGSLPMPPCTAGRSDRASTAEAECICA